MLYSELERALINGSYNHAAARLHNYAIVDVETNEDRSGPERMVRRTWRYQSPGFLKWLKMDRTTHHERCARSARNGPLSVTDRFEWHNGASWAEHSYIVSQDSDGRALVQDTRPWAVSLEGLPRLLRGRVEKAVTSELPVKTQASYNSFVQANRRKWPTVD